MESTAEQTARVIEGSQRPIKPSSAKTIYKSLLRNADCPNYNTDACHFLRDLLASLSEKAERTLPPSPDLLLSWLLDQHQQVSTAYRKYLEQRH